MQTWQQFVLLLPAVHGVLEQADLAASAKRSDVRAPAAR
jgi:hypothetical protein